MKEDILRLRAEGKTYNEIQDLLKCSKGTISYHCGKNQKDKAKKRQRKRRKENILLHKTENFRHRSKKYANEGIRKFQKRDNSVKKSVNKVIEKTFNWEDVIEKFSEDTVCYLSGEKINLLETGNYQLDHINPSSRGGDNSLENMGILHEIVNKMKHNLTPEELIDWCKKILDFNGYEVGKKQIL
jgi:CRISPR/Cas system Type II protein with McrA/HNH and RuvC-like nuclease domain